MEEENPSVRVSLLPEHGSNGLHQSPPAGGGLGATCMLFFATFIAVCGSYVFGAALGYSSPVETTIIDDLGLSTAEYSVFGSIMSIGAMIGAVASGKITDFVGRRGAMGISQLLSAVGWVTIALSQSAWMLDLGRIFTGFGVGLISFVVPIYLAEITPKNLRGRFAAVHQFVLSLGTLLTYFLGAVVSWRILAIIGIVPCLIQLFSLFVVPESPRWLAKIGRGKDAEAALRSLRGQNANISAEANEIREYIEELKEIPEGGILDLFQRIYARSLFVGIGIMVLQQFAGTNAINFYANSIFEAAGFSADIGSVVMAIVKIPTALLGTFLMDKFGRKLLLMISLVGTCIGCLLAVLAFGLQDLQWEENLTPVLVFIGLIIYNGSSGLGLAGIPWIIMSEIFPINIKGSAGSVVSLVNWFSSWIVAYIFIFLMEWSSTGTFFIFLVISVLTLVFVAKFVPETKGKTLEEVQEMMKPST